MQPQTITLSVDLLNNASTTDVIYTREEQYLNRTVYHSAAHTPLMRDMLTLYRTPSKASGNFAGTQKSAMKLTKDFAVPGVDQETTLVKTLIHEISSSVPLGIPEAEQMIVRQTGVAFEDLDVIVGPFMERLSI